MGAPFGARQAQLLEAHHEVRAAGSEDGYRWGMPWNLESSERAGTRWGAPTPAAIDTTGLRAFMARVYRWMFIGLAITGGMAVYTASHEPLLRFVTGHFTFLMFAELGLVMVLSFLQSRLSAPVATALFAGYAGLNGLTLSSIFLIYQLGSIGQAFFLTAGVFGAMSLYATFTKRDLNGWRTFLFMGLVGVVLAGVVNIFLKSDGLSFVTSCACVLVFSGLTAYDTQKLRQIHAGLDARGEGGGKLAIYGALALYLDFINLFLSILRIFGRRRD